MNRKYAVLSALMVLFLLSAIEASAKGATANKTLKVKLNYTGTATVDERHKIFVLLFDANPFTASTLIDSTSAVAPPAPATGASHIVRRLSASGKNKMVTFTDLSLSPVYAAAFIDQNGSYDGHSDPVSGSPMGVYGKAPDKIEPINLADGKTVEITLAFDDSTKTP